MEKISLPTRFKRVTAGFDEVARARLCESSGSEHSEDNSADLSDLIDSFMERNDGNEKDDIVDKHRDIYDGVWSDSETLELLQSLVALDGVDGDVKKTIRDEAERACCMVGISSSEGFKRRLMSRLRERGFDAGLCKSRWERSGQYPAGSYEYIDVVVAGKRYFVQVSLAGQFTIARPANCYVSFLNTLPQIFVGKAEEMKQVVKIMCRAMKESIKRNDLYLPPWRRNGYMQAKWFGSYKRTTNVGSGAENLMRFEKLPGFYGNCRV
ncbi:hypothetical protein IFM89_017880 [Coptis chinensis]|uniref:DUF506 family protein n=1 Tax=Coptis chinensis TaxID=261450 RepID=A0A835I351_9MAGN|nr:hypothetical protein IFM89_017880 [Coptis chinensis]